MKQKPDIPEHDSKDYLTKGDRIFTIGFVIIIIIWIVFAALNSGVTWPM